MKAPSDREQVRMATWNMAYWSHRGMLDDAWKCYLTAVDADFYLIQEGRPGAVTHRDTHLVWNAIGGSRGSSSCIYIPVREPFQEDIGSCHI